MKRKPLGVWFSLALAILAVSGLAGWNVGRRAAAYAFRHQLHQEKGKLSVAERIQLESTLEALYAAQTAKLYELVSANNPAQSRQVLIKECDMLQNLRRNPRSQPITALVDFEMGISYLGIAMADQQENKPEEADKYIKSAQSLFQSLGWKDYSAENLQAIARRQFDHWKIPAKPEAIKP